MYFSNPDADPTKVEVDCPNCNDLPRHIKIEEPCALWSMLCIHAATEALTVNEIRARMKRVDVDAFWNAYGNVLDRLFDGDFDIPKSSRKKSATKKKAR